MVPRRAPTAQDQDQVRVKTLVVAMPGPAQQLVQQLTRDWVSVGTLVTTDQLIVSLRLVLKCRSLALN